MARYAVTAWSLAVVSLSGVAEGDGDGDTAGGDGLAVALAGWEHAEAGTAPALSRPTGLSSRIRRTQSDLPVYWPARGAADYGPRGRAISSRAQRR